MNARHQIDDDLFALQIWKTRHAILELGGVQRFLNSDEAGCHKECRGHKEMSLWVEGFISSLLPG